MAREKYFPKQYLRLAFFDAVLAFIHLAMDDSDIGEASPESTSSIKGHPKSAPSERRKQRKNDYEKVRRGRFLTAMKDLEEALLLRGVSQENLATQLDILEQANLVIRDSPGEHALPSPATISATGRSSSPHALAPSTFIIGPVRHFAP